MGDPLLLDPEQTFTEDVTDRAETYFQAIFKGDMNVDILLEQLKQFKTSIIKKERVVL